MSTVYGSTSIQDQIDNTDSYCSPTILHAQHVPTFRCAYTHIVFLEEIFKFIFKIHRTKHRQIETIQKEPWVWCLSLTIQKSCINTIVQFSSVVNINRRGDKTMFLTCPWTTTEILWKKDCDLLGIDHKIFFKQTTIIYGL